jgi:hypothetical protein
MMKRRAFISNVIAAGSLAGLSASIFGACASKGSAGSTSSAENKIKIGFIPLTDCASVVMAHELGLYKKHGVDVEVTREASWATIRDKVLAGDLQGAHCLFGMPFSVYTGVGGAAGSEMHIAMILNNNGQAITLAKDFCPSVGFREIGKVRSAIEAMKAKKTVTFAMTFPGGTHDLWLRYWLAAAGVDQKSVKIIIDADFYYGAFTKPFKFKTGESEMRLFALHYHDGRRVLKTDNRAAALRAADTDNIRLTTLGGHYIGVYKAGKGKVDALLRGAGQFGRFGQLDQRSGAIAAELGYSFAGTKVADKLKPWLRGGYFRGTGDGDPNDGTHGTFFQVLPTPRIYARTPFFNSMNNEDVFGQLRIKPHAKLAVRFDAHRLRLSSSKDLWYVGGGAFQKRTFG